MTSIRQRSTRRVAARAAALDLEGAALVVGAAALVVGVVASLPLFWGRTLPIAGNVPGVSGGDSQEGVGKCLGKQALPVPSSVSCRSG